MQTQIVSEKLSRRERRERRLQDKIEAKRLAREQISLVAASTEQSVVPSAEPESEVAADSVPPPPVSETRLIQPQSSSAGTKSSSAGTRHVSSHAFIVMATTLARCRTKSVEIIASSQPVEPELRKIDHTRIWEIDGMRLLDRQLHALLRSKTISFQEFWAMTPCVTLDQFVAWARHRAPVVEQRLNTLDRVSLWIRKSGQPTEEGRLIWAAFRERIRRGALESIVSGAIKASPEVESLLGAA